MRTPAEKFLHGRIHETPFGTMHGLNELPFRLVPSVAFAMEQWAKKCEDER